VWTTDYKGQFKLGDGQDCFPLTVADGSSRMLLACQALSSTKLLEARPLFERLFRAYGLPRRIRSDNGVPFATQALGRLSSLAVGWIRLGILPDLTEPGSPQQNGRHERMHLPLKRECTRPPRHRRAQQHRCFDRWRHEYHTLRPHEALADATPASVYKSSPRPYPSRLPRSSIPATTRSAASAATAGSAGTSDGSMSVRPWARSLSDSSRSTTANGRSTSVRSAWVDSMSAPSRSKMRSAGTTAGPTNHCHLCLRT
jgi:Integrase core domain